MQGRILVVGHPEGLAEAVLRTLEQANRPADVADALQAVEAFKRGNQHVVIVMEEPGGGEACRAIKRAAPLTPVIMVFPITAEDADKVAADAGADGVLVAPLRRAAMVSCVHAMERMRALLMQIEELERRTATSERPVVRSRDEAYDFEFLKRLLVMEVKRSRRYRYPISLALVSLDRWHETAARLNVREKSRLLAQILDVITKCVRDIDLTLIYAEDKFLLFLPHTGAEGAKVVAHRVCEHVQQHDGEGARLTASLGVASYNGEGAVSIGALIKDATAAQRRAVTEGGSQFFHAEALKGA
jgi:diguanylate cyclase (GGDEF)-like protein